MFKFWLGSNSYFSLLHGFFGFSYFSHHCIEFWSEWFLCMLRKDFYNLQDFSVLPESIKHLFRWSERGGSFKCLFPVEQSLILSWVLQNFLLWAKLGNILDTLCSFIFDVWDLGLQWFILDISPGENVLEKGCTWQGRVWQPFSGLHQHLLTSASFNPRYFGGFHLISGYWGVWRCTSTKYLEIHC